MTANILNSAQRNHGRLDVSLTSFKMHEIMKRHGKHLKRQSEHWFHKVEAWGFAER